MNNLPTRKSLIKTKIIFLLDYRLFMILVLLVPLYLVNNFFIRAVGYMAMISIFVLGIVDVVFRGEEVKLTSIWGWFFIYSIYNLIMMIRIPTSKAFYAFMLQTVLLLFICILSSVKFNEKLLDSIYKYGQVLFFIILIPASIIVVSGKGIRLFDKYFSFVIYKFMYPCTFFFMVKGKHKFIKTLLFTFVFLVLGERTSALTLLCIYGFYIIIGKLKKQKMLFMALFGIVFFIIIGFTFLYVQLQYMDIGSTINLFFRKYTGGNFFSGRHTIWATVFNYLNQSPLFGYGIDNGMLASANITISIHNTYLHLLLQGGWIGLLIFFMFLRSIWKRYYKNLDDNTVRLSAAYMIGFLMYINFEVSLIGNTVGPGLFMWLIMGIGFIRQNIINTVIKNNIKDEENVVF